MGNIFGKRYSKGFVQNLERMHAERMEHMRKESQDMYRRLEESLEEIRKRAEEQQELINKPVARRREKVDFVNSLNLKIHQTNSLLLVGPKGSGKSTFLWLLGKGPQPKQVFSDGSPEISHMDGYVDTIGLTRWTVDELLKLVVLLIYEGIPQDVILVSTNDRVEHAITAMGLLGINHPLIVIMSNEFWRRYNRKKIELEQDKDGVRRATSADDLEEIYNLEVYKSITDLGLGTPLTHHDDIKGMIDKRAEAGVSPFKSVMAMLRTNFEVSMDIDPEDNIKELLFRYIYIYEKVYCKNQLAFMNKASLRDFI